MTRTLMRLVAAAVPAALAATSAAFADSRAFEVAPFEDLEASNGIQVEVVFGDAPSVRAEGPARKLDELLVKVVRGRLVIRPRLHVFHDQMQFGDTTVHVVAQGLGHVEVENGASLRLTDFEAGDVELEATNGARLVADGRCRFAEIVARRGGEVDADDFVCTEVVARASMGGEVRAHALEAVDAGASMGGDITVVGSPERVRRGRTLSGDITIVGSR